MVDKRFEIMERIVQAVSGGKGFIHSEYRTDPLEASVVSVQANLGRMEDGLNWWNGTINLRHQRAVERTVALSSVVRQLGANSAYATPEAIREDVSKTTFNAREAVLKRIELTSP